MSTKQTAQEIIQGHYLMHLATIDDNGLPTVRGVNFAAGDAENILYFLTVKSSRKVAHIKKNPLVGFAIDRECVDPQELTRIKYLKGTGRTHIIEDPAEADKASRLLIGKYPYLANLPRDPSEYLTIRLEMKNIVVSDHSIGFGHTEEAGY